MDFNIFQFSYNVLVCDVYLFKLVSSVSDTVNQQILAAIKFDVSQNKVIWRLLNLASPRGPCMQCTIDVYVGGDKY